MSPEQAQARTVDPRSDIFSFGLVLYEMLTGRKAFLGDSALSTLSSILRDEAKPIGDTVQGVPPELKQIVDRAMRKEPDRRWQSMQDMRAALLVLKQKSDSGVLQAQLTAAALAAAPNKSGMPPVLLVTAAVVVLASIGAGGWWWIKQREAQRTPPVVAQVAPASRPPVPAAPAAPLSPADAAMTNQDVLKMVGAKVPESIVIGQIKASKTNFDLSPNGVIQLATGGVSKNIIDVMRDPKADSSAAPATPPTAVSSRTDSVSVAGGTPLDITLAEDVPAKLTAGQRIDFTVTKDVEVGDVVVISKGTELSGEIVDTGESKKLGILKTKATFKLTVVNSTGGTPLAIRATPGHSDKTDRPIELSGAKKNKEVLAAAGARYLGYIEGDQSVKIKH
jgi:serine/threonine-protein kinase